MMSKWPPFATLRISTVSPVVVARSRYFSVARGQLPPSSRTCRYPMFQVTMPFAVCALAIGCVARRRIALRPAAAMDDHRDGKGSAGGGKAQLVKLAWIFPVCLDKSRFRREQSILVGQLMPTSASRPLPYGERSLRKPCPQGERERLQAELNLCVAQTTRHQRKSPRGRERVGSSTVSQSSVWKDSPHVA
jgi:hypothetical protein